MTLIDTKLAALMLRCTDRHVRRLVADGRLTNYGSPRQIRLRLDEVGAMSATVC